MERVYVGIGSNLGDKMQNINNALKRLANLPDTDLLSVAPFYRTAPLEYEKQDWFINTVALMKTSYEPFTFLKELLKIEIDMGRKRFILSGPRVIDLDLLLYGQRVIRAKELIIPHPRMQERAFVIVPLFDLDPELVLPGGQAVVDLVDYLKSKQLIEKC